MRISEKPLSNSLNYMPHGSGTNAERWNISPNSHPKFKSGPEMIAEQLFLGRKRPKNIVFNENVGPDAVVVLYMYENPHTLVDNNVSSLIVLTGCILQYGIFGGESLAVAKTHAELDSIPFKAHRQMCDTFEEGKLKSLPTEINLKNSLSTLESALEGHNFVSLDLEAKVKVLYQHGGLLVCQPVSGSEKLRNYSSLVKNNKLVVVQTLSKIVGFTYEYTFLRMSRTRVPGFYKKLHTLKINDSQFTVNDPTGILILDSNHSYEDMVQTFRSI